MRTRKIKLTGQKKRFIISNHGNAKITTGGNGVGHVNYRWIPIFIGVLIGLMLPFLIDWAMFGNPTPCHSIKVFEDGSSLQSCQVRR